MFINLTMKDRVLTSMNVFENISEEFHYVIDFYKDLDTHFSHEI